MEFHGAILTRFSSDEPALFVKERVDKGFDLSLELNRFIHCLLCVVVLVDL